jgi:hypothetical protein
MWIGRTAPRSEPLWLDSSRARFESIIRKRLRQALEKSSNAKIISPVVIFRQILREYIYSFPDGHVQIHGRFDDLRYREIGGGFGFALTPLDDGRVVSYTVVDGSPAA